MKHIIFFIIIIPMIEGSGKRKCAPPSELVMHSLHAIITNNDNNNSWLFPDFMLGSQGSWAVTVRFPKELRATSVASHRPWEGTQALALPVWVLGLMWAELTFRVWSEKFWASSVLYPQDPSRSPKFHHSSNSQCQSWMGP